MTDTVKSALSSWQGIFAILSTIVSAALFIQIQISDRPTRAETQTMIDQSLGAIYVQLQTLARSQEDSKKESREEFAEVKDMIKQLMEQR